MIITAALPWYNELPEDLDRCIRGVANIADRLVALDGSYRRYPNARPRSPDDQVAAIRDASKSTGLDCLILQPDKFWAGQIEKRSYLLAMASVNSDWIATIDADHVVHTDRARAREGLASLNGADVVEVPYFTPLNDARSTRDSAVGIWHEEQAGTRVNIPHLWRVHPGMRVEKLHWWYSAVKGGQRVWLWSSSGEYPILGHHSLPVPYEVEHRCLMRTDEQIRDSRAFLNDREMIVRLTGQEDDQPGLPEPLYDYERRPW